jgi:hypothetical protein
MLSVMVDGAVVARVGVCAWIIDEVWSSSPRFRSVHDAASTIAAPQLFPAAPDVAAPIRPAGSAAHTLRESDAKGPSVRRSMVPVPARQ